jgi:hypothetical protein
MRLMLNNKENITNKTIIYWYKTNIINCYYDY